MFFILLSNQIGVRNLLAYPFFTARRCPGSNKPVVGAFQPELERRRLLYIDFFFITLTLY